jgi:hypothetical protein
MGGAFLDSFYPQLASHRGNGRYHLRFRFWPFGEEGLFLFRSSIPSRGRSRGGSIIGGPSCRIGPGTLGRSRNDDLWLWLERLDARRTRIGGSRGLLRGGSRCAVLRRCGRQDVRNFLARRECGSRALFDGRSSLRDWGRTRGWRGSRTSDGSRGAIHRRRRGFRWCRFGGRWRWVCGI